MSLPASLRLYTPEEVAESVGNITGNTIRGLIAQHKAGWVKGSRGKVLMTEEHVRGLIEYLTQPMPVTAPPGPPGDADDDDEPFRTTSRSAARGR